MPPIPKFTLNQIERISRVIGDTVDGISGPQIENHLARCSIPDFGKNTKWKRLDLALSAQQECDGYANKVVQFIESVMEPVNYTGESELFNQRRTELNTVLSFSGITVGEDGKCRPATKAKTLSDAEQKAERLQRKLRERGVHHDVLRFCEARWLEDNYFHAVLEASKSLAEKIRERTGLTEDGAELVDTAFAFKAKVPFLAFSRLTTKTEQSEQAGLMNLMKGVFGTFRNPTAHDPEIKWEISEQDALDLMTMVSFLHRRIDTALRTDRIVEPA